MKKLNNCYKRFKLYKTKKKYQQIILKNIRMSFKEEFKHQIRNLKHKIVQIQTNKLKF